MSDTNVAPADSPRCDELEQDLRPNEAELLREMLRAIRSLRYGSVVLTVHDGRLVEIQKTERIRLSSLKT